MRRLAFAALLLAASALQADSRWQFHNTFWMSLHQTLIDDATRSTPRDLSSWTAEERTAWNESVAEYRTAGGHGDITFTAPMTATTEGIAAAPDNAADVADTLPLAKALRRVAPVYRAHGWASDEKVNRFFIAYASALVREEGEGLVQRHEAVYHAKWPKQFLVYITPSAGPFGAYTFTGPLGTITTMASREDGYQGFRSLEMLLHESSHAVVYPNRGLVADAIDRAAKAHGVTAPRNLWHAILFATSGELTRQLLNDRGVTAFVPSSTEMFTKVWPMFRDPIAKYWVPYLNGEGTLDQAIDKIVVAMTATAR